MKNISTSIAARKILDYHSGAIALTYDELENYSNVMRQAAQNRTARLQEPLWIDRSGKNINLAMSKEIDFTDILPGTETKKGKAFLTLHNDLQNL